MARYVNTDVGIYHITSLCDKRDADGHKLYHVKCKYCGYESDMRLFNIKQPKICKHKNKEDNFINFTLCWQNKKLQSVFHNMKDRCYNPNNNDYCWYGAKGIKICEEWLANPKLFEEWAVNNGYIDTLTIDRINSDKDYCPSNCRWISLEENARRAGKVNWITVNNETLTGKQWAEKLKIGKNIINTAIREYGINKTKILIEAMLKEPPTGKNRKPKQSWFSVYNIQL